LQLFARHTPLAPHTPHEVESTVQIDYIRAARGLVQPIDILGHQQRNAPTLFERG
jgi:hypothetical protein